jgi:hypothetical protein
MLGIRSSSAASRSARAARRQTAFGSEDGGTSTAGGAAPSYSVRICGRCRTPATTVVENGRVREQCRTCGRTRGWA